MNVVLLLTVLATGGPSFAVPTWSPDAASHALSATRFGLAQDTAKRIVYGQVTSEQSGSPLPFAIIELGAGAGYRAAISDSTGRYILRDVAAGRQRVRVTTLDHEPFEITVEIPQTGTLQLDLSLNLAPVALVGITAISEADPSATATGGQSDPAGRGSPADPELRALEATPGVGELGLADGARAEPRIDPGDPESALYVRGAAYDLKLVLLDGAPVYAPFHLGGLLDAFQPNVLRSAWLYSGGAPARYDGGLSHILELNTRSAAHDRFHSAGAIDLLGAQARVESPLGPASFLAGGRYLHRVGTDGLASSPLPYDYADGLARVDLSVAPNHLLSATAFFNEESVRLDPLSGFEEPARWGNLAGSLRYRGDIAGVDATITTAFARFSTRLPVGVEAPGVADGRSDRVRLAADFTQPVGTLQLSYGASFDKMRIEYEARSLADTGGVWLTRSSNADALGAYGEVVWELFKDVALRGGLRANMFLSASKTRLAPRLSLGWDVSESSTLFVAGGRYYQYLRVPETILSGNLSSAWNEVVTGEAFDLPTDDPLAVAGATHLVVGMTHAPRPTLRLGMEGYYKAFDGAPQIQGMRASGLDLWIDWTNGSWAAWAGYSLGWAWFQEGLATTSDNFSARHLLSGGLRVPLPSAVFFDLRLASSSGLDYTPIPTGQVRRDAQFEETSITERTGSVLSGAPTGSYLRLDAQVSRSFTASALGTRIELVPYLRVLNALDRRDALFYQLDLQPGARPRSLDSVSFLPIVGIEWRQ
jgi:hypothetical protein